MTTSVNAATTAFSSTKLPRIASPSHCRLVRSRVETRASSTDTSPEKFAIATAGLTVASCVLPQIASAAQEVLVVAEGEPLVVQAGWAALAVSFTMSIAIVVWGRSGL